MLNGFRGYEALIELANLGQEQRGGEHQRRRRAADDEDERRAEGLDRPAGQRKANRHERKRTHVVVIL